MTTIDPLLPEGFRIAACDAGIAKGERPDLMLAVADEAFPFAAVFTKNRIIAAPVALCREHARRSGHMARALLVNAGNANCCTGANGDMDAMRSAELVAATLDCPPEQVLILSTGVIGKRLPMDRVEAALPGLFDRLSRDSAMVQAAAEAIRTTDTCPKIDSRAIACANDEQGTLLGLAKGSGMIHPDMATMLGFLFGDVDPGLDLGLALRAAVDQSFNRITVDGDTSTNDSVILWSSHRKALAGEPTAYIEGLDSVCLSLAKKIAADGEGATKLVRVHVTGASTQSDARLCATTIATSLLVKTAVHGEDPNWGRILAAAGRANVALDTRKVKVGIGEATLFAEDQPHPEAEPEACKHLRGKEVLIWIDLGSGVLEAEAWTCDLSADYVSINADYRT